ncbi:UvrD-helicase domain-containing protein [Leuconostoc pseudomesenteroides]|uniref:UvrD-helicase domain-containing protein n=1 Tax=Leuconostoc pseudomesenteroides TaxID=33968 RepID=UPI00301C77E0
MAEQIDSIKTFIYQNRKKGGLLEVRGPAGSGKTYSLVNTATSLFKDSKLNGYIISLTNVAVYELQHRMDNRFADLIMTSHHFAIVWLKRFFLTLAFDKKIEWNENSLWKKLKKENVKSIVFLESPDENIEKKPDQYVVLPHEVLSLFSEALKKSTEFANKVSSGVDYIFIDEYQDTDASFLDSLIQVFKKKLIIAIFGDPMQKVYMSRLKLQEIEGNTKLRINLLTNYRSDSKLIPLFNALRLEEDGLNQISPDNQEARGKVFLVSANRKLQKSDVNYIAEKTKIKTWHYLTTTHVLRLGLGSEYNLEIVNQIRGLFKKFFGKNVPLRDFIEKIDSIEEMQIIMGIGALNKTNYNYHDIRRIKQIFVKTTINGNWPVSYLEQIKLNVQSGDLSLIDDLDYSLNVLEWTKTILSNYQTDIDKIYKLLSDSTRGSADTIQGVKGLEFDNVVVNLDQGDYRSLGLKSLDLVTKGYSDNRQSNFMIYVGVTRAKSNVVIFVNTSSPENLLEKMKNFLDSIENFQYTSFTIK